MVDVNKLVPGTRVRVTFEGTILEDEFDLGGSLVKTDQGYTHAFYAPPSGFDTGAEVEILHSPRPLVRPGQMWTATAPGALPSYYTVIRDLRTGKTEFVWTENVHVSRSEEEFFEFHSLHNVELVFDPEA